MRNEYRPKKRRKGQWRQASVCMSRPLSAKTKSCACRTVHCNRNARSCQKRVRFYPTRVKSSNGDGRCLQKGFRRRHSSVCQGLSVARSEGAAGIRGAAWHRLHPMCVSCVHVPGLEHGHCQLRHLFSRYLCAVSWTAHGSLREALRTTGHRPAVGSPHLAVGTVKRYPEYGGQLLRLRGDERALDER